MASLEIEGRVFLIPEPESPCDLWRSYFEKLKDAVGTENARMLWLLTWQANGDQYCTTNAEFNRFLSRNRIDVSSAASRAVADVSQIGSNVLGLGKNLTRVLSVGIPVAAGLGLLIVLYFLFRTARNTGAADFIPMKKGGPGQ